MRRARFLLWPLLLLVAVNAPPAFGAAGDNIFAGLQVHTVAIDFAQPAYWDSLVRYYNEGLEQFMAATVTVDGVPYDSVGVRLKGNASYTHPNMKKPFRLSFDEYRDAQRWDGLKGVHLNNCWEDPTFIREKLHLDYCRTAGIPAPRGNFAELYLNGELWGFYSLVEHVDKTLLSTRFGNSGGNLYKAVDGFLNPMISDFKWYGSDPSNYYNRYELKTDDSPNPWTDIIAVIDSLNNSPNTETALPPVVNLDSVYRAFATDNLMASFDSYAGSGRNFYSYFNSQTGKMEWVIWDAGMSFGSFWGSGTNYETVSVTFVSNAVNRPLASRVFATPAFRDQYLQAYCSLFTTFFSEAQLFPQIDAIANLIRPYVYADPRKMYTNAQFEENIVSDITVGGHRKPGLKSFIPLRRANVESQLAALGVSCATTIEPGEIAINEFAASNTLILDPSGEAEDWIELYNNTTQAISLAGAYLSDDPATPTKWQFPAGTTIAADGYLIVWADEDAGQPGLHASFKLSASGEFIGLSDSRVAVVDSVSFGPQTTDLTMARIPNGTGPFVQGPPTFNAHNGYGNEVRPGEVAINEFMADNTLILDPSGEAEDWIELYNTTSRAIDLGGLYMTDDFTNPAKWQIPEGTTIAVNGYLMVWADDDAGQPGLHANFKLSASGERIMLSNTSLSVVDSTSFGPQQTNIAMARIPNGAGPFIATPTPTPEGTNLGPAVAPGAVAINEFMADNTLILDPSGEAEDWIELYNNTNQAVYLGGMYMTDNFAIPTKWQIPGGTTIGVDGYLIVWADEDQGQPGLHAGFKLSASGERIMLSNMNLSVVDSTSFGPQTTDIAMARIPNGTGPFVATPTPTPGAVNSGPITGVEAVVPARLTLDQVAPNPFRRGGTIGYGIAERGRVLLQVYDPQGRLVTTLVDRELAPGTYRVRFAAAEWPSGVYFCRLESAGTVVARKMLVVE